MTFVIDENETPADNLRRLERFLEEELTASLPTAEITAVVHNKGVDLEDLRFDLIDYTSAIAGYCSWGKGILRWTSQQADEARSILSTSFFEQYPQYAVLQFLITEENTPGLYEELNNFESARIALLTLIP